MANPRSTASIAGHPIHPMLIPFPIAFFVSTFVCDLIYWQTANAGWATAGKWLLGAGLIMAALAAIVGLTDLLSEPRIRALNEAWWHAGGNVVVVLIELYNWYARYAEGTAFICQGDTPGSCKVTKVRGVPEGSPHDGYDGTYWVGPISASLPADSGRSPAQR